MVYGAKALTLEYNYLAAKLKAAAWRVHVGNALDKSGISAFQLHAVRVKILGAGSSMPAMAVIMGHAVCHMVVPGLRRPCGSNGKK